MNFHLEIGVFFLNNILHIESSTDEKSPRKYSFKKKKGNASCLANVSGEIMPFPSHPAHHKSSEEIMFKIN